MYKHRWVLAINYALYAFIGWVLASAYYKGTLDWWDWAIAGVVVAFDVYDLLLGKSKY